MSSEKKLDRFLESKTGLFLINFLNRVKEDNVSAIGAQLAYFLLVSLFPFMMFFLNILSFTPIATESVLSDAIVVLPKEIQDIIFLLVKETVISSNETFLSLSVITGLWAASKGVMAFIKVMNQAYGVKEERGYIYTRFLSIILTIALFISFILALLTLVFGEFLTNKVFIYFGFATNFISFWKYFRKIISLVSIIIIFTFMFKFAPSNEDKNKIKFIHAVPGAVVSSLGWVITSLIFSYYVNNFGNFAKTYGSLGGIVALMLWLYMSSIIIIIGGEINATLKHMRNKEK